jgi:D-glycero-D-manno-heptose 1,7-bisphosphate phosphatase
MYLPTWPPSAVFLDRDGVLIENVHSYVRTWEEVQIFDQAVEAFARLNELGVPMVVVTNQAGVGKGIMTLEHARTLNDRILAAIEARGKGKGKFLASYICHHVRDANCDCRKPRPGMLIQAAADHGLDLAHAVMVGDGVTDLQAAEAAGVHGVLVRTGRGVVQEGEMRAAGLERPVFEDLLTALNAGFGL